MNYHDLQGGFEARYVGYPDGAGAAVAILSSARYILPTFEEHTTCGYKRQDPYAKLFEDRIMFLGEQVDDNSADDIMAQLLVLESQDPDLLITTYINSPRGSFTATTVIYDTMQHIKPEIQTMRLGQAASVAAVLLVGGSPDKHLASPSACVLIHQPTIRDTQEQVTDLTIIIEEIGRMWTWLEKTLSKHPGRTLEQMYEDIDRDRILTAAQVKEYGLIDQVLSPRKGPNNQGLGRLLAFFSRGGSLGCRHFARTTGWHLMKQESTQPGESGREKPLHQLELPRNYFQTKGVHVSRN